MSLVAISSVLIANAAAQRECNMEFVAIDVETANSNRASICAIGFAVFKSGVVTSEWYSLVNPRDFFDPMNVSIHGIKEADVSGAPAFRDIAEEMNGLLAGQVVVTHTPFDRVALCQAADRWAVSAPRCDWLDSARVARRTWADCARSGYGLADLCYRIGYTFKHHDALEDAKAAGHVMLAAMAKAGLDLEILRKQVLQPISATRGASASITRDGNPDGPLAGEVVVFTGALELPRREAADLAASVGCSVAKNVTKSTTLLVVGDVDVQKLAGHTQSAKHRRAVELVAAGASIRIIRETDFRRLVDLD